ncbi:phosphotransferase [Bacillus testis]|uniref:phosphotransferase n=1 Tax=Bacillus testis TaxID=1622072 RepID=UPI00067E9320|nr:phosphotransferase [Bacillus testis]
MGNRSFREDGSIRKRLINSLDTKGESLQKVDRIRENVFKVTSNKRKYMVKGFSSTNKLEAQKLLTKKLKENGFHQTYRFIKSLPDFNYDGMTYSWIEYLNPSRDKFSYREAENRSKGLFLLQQFHQTTRSFYKSIPASKYNQLRKWQERLKLFKSNAGIVRGYVSSRYVDNWIEWGERALKGMEKFEDDLYKEPNCIIHGDVAHHNFFNSSGGKLNIIDFDLIHQAPPIIDFIQYSNRIMPYVKDASELFSYPQLKAYKNNPAFLYALLFPADIYREWNRLEREDLYSSNEYMHSIWKLTVDQYAQRMNLYKDIYKRIN